ncbi:sulfur carrier protein ThiS [Alteromonas sp. C1M14]|uniref:sulfur carrier protein ThiS n=1 Tax=Alteromonas sp. C1M14 TaxID=2841567 RepID=UPI001C080AE3|nr:sulfur carrier protein ThiS [Alteromonas sp. C1M14]MBU2979952.1 sulfur carrier protein ThiS [Alteromonas sp. C1M14]
MEINCNGNPMMLPGQATLVDVVREYNSNLDTLAVAVNHTIIPRSDWANYQLTEQDNVDIFTLVAGG